MIIVTPWGSADNTSPSYKIGLAHGMMGTGTFGGEMTACHNSHEQTIIDCGGTVVKTAEVATCAEINDGIRTIPKKVAPIDWVYQTPDQLFEYYGWYDGRNEMPAAAAGGQFLIVSDRNDAYGYTNHSTSMNSTYCVRSDGYSGPNDRSSNPPMWDTAKDLIDNFGNKYRWMWIYSPREEAVGPAQGKQTILYFLANLSAMHPGNIQDMPNLKLFELAPRTLTFMNNYNNWQSFCRNCYALTELPPEIDTSLVRYILAFCENCYSLRCLPAGVISPLVTDWGNFCRNCYALTALPEGFITTNAVGFNDFCYSCYSLFELPATMQTGNGVRFNNFCQNSSSLSRLPTGINTRNATTLEYFCFNATGLTEIPPDVVIPATLTTSTFLASCPGLPWDIATTRHL